MYYYYITSIILGRYVLYPTGYNVIRIIWIKSYKTILIFVITYSNISYSV